MAIEGVSLNARIIATAKRLIKALFTTQNKTRRDLVTSLQSVSGKCEDAYSTLLERLGPVKTARRNPLRFAAELHALAADKTTRSAFKPDKLCGEIDHLLINLTNNLNGLKYSVNWSSVGGLRDTLKAMGNYDAALKQQYERFMSELDSVATQIENAKPEERSPLAAYALSQIAALEAELRSSLHEIRQAKADIVLTV